MPEETQAMRSPRKYLLALTGLTLSAVVASLAAQGPPPGQGPYPGQVPPLAAPAPSAVIQPTTMTITAPQADIYSGPAANYYVTSHLRTGERIVVLGESKRQPGWLEILPPVGSFSWIDAKYVKTVPGVDKIGIVDTNDPKGSVPIRPGSSVVGTEPNVEIARVAQGTQVVLLDRPTPGNGTSWFPIAPTATEVRYIPADAVRGGTYASNGYGGNPYQPTGYSNSGYPQNPYVPAASAAAAAASLGFVALAQQGDQAYTAGNNTRAYQLYTEALGQTTDAGWQQYLRGMIARIAPQGQGGSTWAPPGGAPTVPTGLGVPPPAPLPNSPPTVGVPGQKQWSSWGILRTTNTSHEGQPMYVLEATDGTPQIYATTLNGTSLREYVGQTVCLYGTIGYRNDQYIRMTYMVAEQVATPPGSGQPGQPGPLSSLPPPPR
jgi:hypothetical protein